MFTLGYPLIEIEGQEQKVRFGHVNSLSGLRDVVRFLQVDVPIQGGNSGGPLLNTRGEVVGVIESTVNPTTGLKLSGFLPQNVNYAVKSDYVLPLLVRYEISPVSKRSGPRREAAIVRQIRDSVVLVVAR